MSSEDLIRKFTNEIKLRAFKDKFVDHDEEMAILKIAIDEGVEIEDARRVLLAVCADNQYAVESHVEDEAKAMLKQFATNDGHVDQKEFNDVIDMMLRTSHDVLKKTKCIQTAKALMIENEWVAREGMFKGGKWFSAIGTS